MEQSNLNIVIKGNIADKGTPRKYYILFFLNFRSFYSKALLYNYPM